MTLVEARTVGDWRAWLAEHGESAKEAWLVIHHKDSDTPSPRYHEAVEQALCFGWIDGLHRGRDAHSSQLRFTPRGPRSTWSQINRDRAATMSTRGLMTARGQAMIDLAKETGAWHAAESVPDDLRELLDGNAEAARNFDGFPPSSKRLILEWIATAKKPATRRSRVTRTVTLAADNVRANHPGNPKPPAR
jgi:uncharacterized protein YdeI (YjbR/CyaY-like superfamily)